MSDVSVLAFASNERQQLFLQLQNNKQLAGPQLAEQLTELRDYVNILLLRGEEEFQSIAPADRSFEAFELARRLQITANKERKNELTQRLRAAEEDGDVGLVSRLLGEYQALLIEED